MSTAARRSGRQTGRRRTRPHAAALRLGGMLASRAYAGHALAAACCAAVGAASLILALTMPSIITSRDERAQTRTPFALAQDDESTAVPEDFPSILWAQRLDEWGGRGIRRILLSDPDGASTADRSLVPPGLTSLPEPGTAVVSPALQREIDEDASGHLRARVGRVVGVISAPGLLYPDEVVAYLGAPANELSRPVASAAQTGDGSGFTAVRVNRFGPGPVQGRASVAATFAPHVERSITVLLQVAALTSVVPLVLLLLGSTMLARARRQRALDSLGIMGVSPAAVRAVLAGETLLTTTAGWVAGYVLYRPELALVRHGVPASARWFPTDAMPNPAILVVSVVAMLALGVVTALAGFDGGWRRGKSRLGLLTLSTGTAAIAAIALLPQSLIRSAGGWLPFVGLAAIALALFGVWTGLARLVTLCASVLGHSGRPSFALAGRRLRSDPHTTTTGAVAVTLAVVAAGVIGAITHQISDVQSQNYAHARLPDLVTTWPVPDSRDRPGRSAVAIIAGASIRGSTADSTPADLTATALVTDCRAFLAVVGADAGPCRAGEAVPVSWGGGSFHVVSFAGSRATVEPGAGGRALTVPITGPGVVLADPGGIGGALTGVDLIVDAGAGMSAADLRLPQALITRAAGQGERTLRTRLLTSDPGAVVNTNPQQVRDALAHSEQYRGWFGGSLLVTLAVCGAYVLLASAVALAERRRLSSYLSVIGAPARLLRAIWLVVTGLPVVVGTFVGWGLVLLIDVGFSRIAELPVDIQLQPIVASAALAGTVLAVLSVIALTGVRPEVRLADLRTAE